MITRTGLLSGCLIVVCGIFSLPACLKDKIRESYGQDSVTVNTRIYIANYTIKGALLDSINGSAAQPIVQPGQLYINGSYIYLNEMNAGIHIIDNSDPAHPVQKGFVNIPGNQNIAIRGNILYADMYADLLAIDISNPANVKIEDTLWGVFPYRGAIGGSNTLVTTWTSHDTSFRQKASGDPLQEPYYAITGTNFYTMSAAAVPGAANYIASTTATAGTAGSTATIALVGDYLYYIPESHSLGVIDVTTPNRPAIATTLSAGLDLETIFPMQDKLLLGSMEGVYVYSIANPVKPVQIGEFKHGTACDPVIADASYAYVTLHSGTGCGAASNELDILGAKDLTNTSLLKTYPMTGPSGLGKDGSILFVCDGQVIKVFNAADPLNLQELTELKVSNAYDVIAANNLLLVASTAGLYEYDYSDPSHINQLSHLTVN